MGTRTLVHQDDSLHLFWDDELSAYVADWQPAFRKGDALKRSYEACLEAARARRAAPWIVDVSRVAVLDQADQKWISEWFWPEFTKAGVRYQAVVQATGAVGKMSTRAAAKGVWKSGIEVSVHETRADAEAAVRAWLEKRARE